MLKGIDFSGFIEKKSITSVVIFSVVAITTAVMLFAGLTTYHFYQSTTRNEFERNLDVLSDQFAAGLVLPVWNFDESQVKEILESIMKNRNIAFVEVSLMNEGVPFKSFSYGRDSEWNIVRSKGSVYSGNFSKRKRDIVLLDQKTGEMKIAATYEFLDMQMGKALALSLLFVFLVDLVLTFGLFYFLRKVIIFPIRSVEQYAAGVIAGKEIVSPDKKEFRAREIKDLTESIDFMVSMLAQRYKKLQESENKYRALFNGSNDAIFLKNIGAEISLDRFIEVNETAVERMGYSREELARMGMEDIVKSEPGEIARYREIVLEKGSLLFETMHVKKDGTVFPVEINSHLIEYSGTPAILFVVRDITERKRADFEIRKTLSEKESLIKELYHRTKNNMQIISSLLRLHSRETSDMKAVEIFQDMDARIQSMSLVHQKLYQSMNLASISILEYVSDLSKLLLQSYVAPDQTIDVISDISDIRINIDLAVPFGLLLNELLTNSLKHGFPGQKNGKIEVVLSTCAERELELKVSDNGVGIPDGFDLRRQGKMGIQTIIAIGENQLHGKVTFSETPGGGLTCHLSVEKLFLRQMPEVCTA